MADGQIWRCGAQCQYCGTQPRQAGIERVMGLEHFDPENLHIKRWASLEDGSSFSHKFVPGQTLFGKRRTYQKKVVFAEFEGICSGEILTFEPKDPKVLLPELLPFLYQTDIFLSMLWVHPPALYHRAPADQP